MSAIPVERNVQPMTSGGICRLHGGICATEEGLDEWSTWPWQRREAATRGTLAARV